MFLQYAYEHDITNATTGYFSCRPQLDGDMRDYLELYLSRPMDTFLYRYLLAVLPQLDISALEKILGPVWEKDLDEAERYALIALMRNCAGLAEHCGQILQKLAPGWSDQHDLEREPLPMLSAVYGDRLALQRQWSDLFREHIQLHKPLPSNLPDSLYDEVVIARTRDRLRENGALASMREKYFGLEHVGENYDYRAIYATVVERLQNAGILAGPEMRHEASLSPIALLRQWHMDLQASHGRNRHKLSGVATAYGRGLSLMQARMSCVMEIVERASAYASVECGGAWGHGLITARKNELDLRLATVDQLHKGGEKTLFLPGIESLRPRFAYIPLHWLQARNSLGEDVWTPAQQVFLFMNLDEPELPDLCGSTGLASGLSQAGARLSALLEIMERYAHATMPFMRERCFAPLSRDEKLQALLDDYRARGIFIIFQDITTELGVPAYRCFVRGRDDSVAQATGSGLKGSAAAWSALTETPWPYVWAQPAPYGKPSARPEDNLPFRYLEDLPDYSTGQAASDLSLLEKTLEKRGLVPVYATLDRIDLQYPVVRAFIPNLPVNTDFDAMLPPSPELFVRWLDSQ